MRIKNVTRLFTCFMAGVLLASSIGCDFVDKILEPEEKTYDSSIYNNTNRKDEDFNNYDGEKKDEDKDKENASTPTPTKEEVKKQGYTLSYDTLLTQSVEDLDYQGYKITFDAPGSLIDYKKSTKAPDKPELIIGIDGKYSHFDGISLAHMGNDTKNFVIVANLFSDADFDGTDRDEVENFNDLIKISERKMNDYKANKDRLGITESNVVTLQVNDLTTVYYRVYPYTNKKGLPSAIIMAVAPMGERYFYTEYWIDGLYENFDYERLIVQIYGSARIEPQQAVVIE